MNITDTYHLSDNGNAIGANGYHYSFRLTSANRVTIRKYRVVNDSPRLLERRNYGIVRARRAWTALIRHRNVRPVSGVVLASSNS